MNEIQKQQEKKGDKYNASLKVKGFYNSINRIQARVKFLQALHILYLSFFNSKKDSTSLNHCKNDGALISNEKV